MQIVLCQTAEVCSYRRALLYTHGVQYSKSIFFRRIEKTNS